MARDTDVSRTVGEEAAADTLRRMRVVVQRVNSAAVLVDGEVVGSIEAGLLLLVGIAESDNAADLQAAAAKIVGLRIFADEEGLMNRGLAEVGGQVLAVSQFTLLADIRKGRRPSFTAAARPDSAGPSFLAFCEILTTLGVDVETGRFGANMEVRLVNSGPVTIIVDTVEGRVI